MRRTRFFERENRLRGFRAALGGAITRAWGRERIARFAESPGLRAGPKAHPRSAQPETADDLDITFAACKVAGLVAQARSASGDGRQAE